MAVPGDVLGMLKMSTITSGGTYYVSSGDVYVIDPSLDEDVKFKVASGQTPPVDFEIRFDESNHNDFKIQIYSKDVLSPTITLADDVDISDVELDLKYAASTVINGGDNVSIEDIEFSKDGDDAVTFGDGFSLPKSKSLDLGDGDNTLVLGDDANIQGGIKGGDGVDNVTLGDDANLGSKSIDLGKSSSPDGDSLVAGDGLIAKEIKTGYGDDYVRAGNDAGFKKLDMGKGADEAYVGSFDTHQVQTVTLDGGSGSGSGILDQDCLTLDLSWLSDAERAKFIAELEAGGYTMNGPTEWVFTDEDGDGEPDESLKLTITVDTDGDGKDDFKFKLRDWEQIKVVCFARGTRIMTQKGEIGIEHLSVGDKVLTMDSGFQRIRWIGSTRVPARGHLAPIRIQKGTMGNTRDLLVSPQHRVLVRNAALTMLLGQNDALVAAKHLVDNSGFTVEEGGSVEYFHMLFDRHELVFAEGMPSESFHPGAVGMDSMAEGARREIYELFPELSRGYTSYGGACRPCLKPHEVRAVLAGAEPQEMLL